MKPIKALTPEQIAACEAEKARVLGTHSVKKQSIKWRTVADRLRLSKLSVLKHFSPDAELKQYLNTINRCEARRPETRRNKYVPKRAPVGELDRKQITKFYRQGMSPSFIAPMLPAGVGRSTIKRIFAQLEPKYGAERKAAQQQRGDWKERRKLEMYGLNPSVALGEHYRVGPRPDPHVIAERDRRMQAYYELPECVRMLGDPPPGQSALDRRK